MYTLRGIPDTHDVSGNGSVSRDRHQILTHYETFLLTHDDGKRSGIRNVVYIKYNSRKWPIPALRFPLSLEANPGTTPKAQSTAGYFHLISLTSLKFDVRYSASYNRRREMYCRTFGKRLQTYIGPLSQFAILQGKYKFKVHKKVNSNKGRENK
jgi:hypothetical protein